VRRDDRPLWRCPKCGHRFVTRNLWHSCVRVPVRSHFTGRAPALYATYRAWAALARSCGPVTIYAQKTRIVFQARVRFGGAVVRSGYLDAGLWLRRRAGHPRLFRVESFGSLGHGLHFRLTGPGDIDGALAALMREAYARACAPRGAPSRVPLGPPRGAPSRVPLRAPRRASSRAPSRAAPGRPTSPGRPSAARSRPGHPDPAR
jgi:hypothetical protein